MATPLERYLRVQGGVDRRMAKILMEGASSAAKQIRDTYARSSFSSAVRRAQLQMIQKELYGTLDDMFGGLNAEIRLGYEEASQAAVDAEAELVSKYLDAAGEPMSGFRAAGEKLRAKTVDLVVARGVNNIPLSRQVYKTNALAKGYVDRLVNNGLLTGMNAKTMAREVKAFIRPDVRGGVSYAAQRLARTEINNAFHRTQIDLAQEEPWVTGMKWNLSRSHPTPDECDEYADEVHYRGGKPGVFRKTDVPNKPHPQCLCFITSEVVSETTFVENFGKGRYRGFLGR